MFEFHDDTSAQAVAALFGGGVELNEGLYVENTATGDLLASAGLLGRGGNGGIYLLRWNGRTLGLHSRMASGKDETGSYAVFTLEELGASILARMHTKVQLVQLEQDDAEAALRVAAEACVVLEATLATYGPHVRVNDPDGSGRELSPADYGYPNLMSRKAVRLSQSQRRGGATGGD